MALAELYADEKYILVWKGCKGRVLLQTAASPVDNLKALWQVCPSFRCHETHT